MAAWTTHDHFKATAAQRLGNYGVSPGTVDDHTIGDCITPAWRGKNVPHAAEVALALFADVPDKHERQRVRNSRTPQHACNGQHRGNTSTVVGDARAIQPAALLPNI